MRLGRRNLGAVLAGGAGLGLLSTSALSRNPYRHKVHSTYPFEEPIVTEEARDADILHPTHYQELIRTPAEADERLRSAYIEQSIPAVGTQLDGYDLERGFLVIVGVLLPSKQKLQFDGTEVDYGLSADGNSVVDRTMHRQYEVVDRNSAANEQVFYTVIEYWETDGSDPPDQLVTEVSRDTSQ